jgi:hypothetical protein
MNLEALEQQCLAYLKQVSNPLVRIDVLYDHLARELDLAGFSREELVRFLEKHDLVKVMQPAMTDKSMAPALKDAGLLSEPTVILETRIPTPEQMSAMLLEQIDDLGNALANALRNARAAEDAHTESLVKASLERASQLRQRIVDMHRQQRRQDESE